MNRASLRTVVYTLGAALAGLMAAVAFLSPEFAYGGDPAERPTVALTALMVAAGGLYLAAAGCVVKYGVTPHWAVLIGVGVLIRVVLIPSTPILEDDFYRYLWDGAVSAHGHNPYGLIPEEAKAQSSGTPIGKLAAESGPIIDRVNHPHLATIYPPVAQMAFAAAHVLSPFSLLALRAVLLLFDTTAFLFLIALLRVIGAPPAYSLIYWWNPLLVKETVSSAHMDVIALPFLLAAVIFALRTLPFRAGLQMALAVGVKLWPALLAPLLLRRLGTGSRTVAALGLSLALLALCFWPVTDAWALGERSGFFAYTGAWEMNDALFMVLYKAVEWPQALLGASPSEAAINRTARALVAALVGALAIAFTWRGARDGQTLCNQAAILIGVLFMLSPTQFPWYYVWLLPFLAAAPRGSLLVLTATLPLYYLKFWFDARGHVHLFHNGIVWLEYAPVFGLAAYEWWRARRRGRAASEGAAHA